MLLLILPQTIYPVVHPVPDPTAHAGFTCSPHYTTGHTDKKYSEQTDISECSSYRSDESQEVDPLLSESDHETVPASAAHKHVRTVYSSLDANEPRDQETIRSHRHDENGQAKVTDA